MEKSIIDELFNARCDDFESNVLRQDKKCNKFLYKVTNICEDIMQIVPEDMREIVSKKSEEIYKNILEFTTSWNKKYYGLGIKDGIKFKQELKTNIRERKENEEKFLIDYEADFNDFLENFRVNILYKNKEYNQTLKERDNILNKYPRVKDFYEDNEFYKFNEEELNAILDLMRIEGILYGIETREAFYLGMSKNEIA